MSAFQLIYCSRNALSSSKGSQLNEIRQILSVSQRNNKRDGITGFLIYDKDWIVQILEGERSAVTITYDRICRDRRHSDIVKISAIDNQTRLFPDWAMGGVVRGPDVQEVYLASGIDMTTDPRKLSPKHIIKLALGLHEHQATMLADKERKLASA